MAEDRRYKILSLLKTEFPGFEIRLDQLYWKDPLFRQIAREYHECIRQEAITQEKGRKSEFYKETINELSEELLSYLNNHIP